MSERTYSESFVDFYYAMGCGLAYGLASESWFKGVLLFLWLLLWSWAIRVIRRVWMRRVQKKLADVETPSAR